MRPVDRGPRPPHAEITKYSDAKPDLVRQLGSYCSYCERRQPVSLAVEHVRPQALYPDLATAWDNLLLACVNCNSTKKDKDVVPTSLVLPDRDNTFACFRYSEQGEVKCRDGLTAAQTDAAQRTLDLTGLSKRRKRFRDSNGHVVDDMEMVGQRMQVFGIATEARRDLDEEDSEKVRRATVRTALGEGFFSIWMTVFADDPDMRQRFIDAFPGTARDCFDPVTTALVSPRPSNGLDGAGKV